MVSLNGSKCRDSFSFYAILNVFIHEQITEQASQEVKKTVSQTKKQPL